MEVNNSSVSVNSSSSQDLESRLAIPYVYLVFFIVIYTVAAALAIVGNTLVVIVLVFRQRLTNPVRYSLINLAVADILTAAFCIPFTVSRMVYGQWFFSPFMCPAVYFAQEVALAVSVLTLTAIGIDRYLGLMFPFKYHIFKTERGILITMVSIWLLACLMSSVVAIFSHVRTQQVEGVSYKWCVYGMPPDVGYVYTFARFALLFAIPMSILTFTYSTIAWKLFHHTVPGNADLERDSQQHQNMIKVVKMLIMIVVLFALCLIPWQCVILAGWFGGLKGLPRSVERRIFLSVYWLVMANSFINPIIYSFCNNDFLSDLKFILYKLNALGKVGKEKIISRINNQSTATSSSSISGILEQRV